MHLGNYSGLIYYFGFVGFDTIGFDKPFDDPSTSSGQTQSTISEL
jgi:hypothetical protein